MAAEIRKNRSGLWIGGVLVAAAIVVALLVALTPHNDTSPVNDTNNAGPTTVQPVQPIPSPQTQP